MLAVLFPLPLAAVWPRGQEQYPREGRATRRTEPGPLTTLRSRAVSVSFRLLLFSLSSAAEVMQQRLNIVQKILERSTR